MRSLFELPPGPDPRYWIATRAALSMGAPLGLLTLLGYESLGLQTAAGSFVALFAASAGAAERAKVLPVVGGILLLCAGLGVLLAPWPALLVTGLVVVAILTSGLAFAFRIGPPGAVFFVLVYGLAGNITTEVDGVRLNSPTAFLVAIMAGMLFAYLVALTPLLRRTERARDVRPLRELLPGPWVGPGEIELIARIAVASIVGALVTALLLDPHRAYWTVAASVAVVGLSTARSYSLTRGLHRMTGTLLGAVVYLVIAPLSEHPILLVLVFTVLQFIIEVVVVRNYALALVFITPLVLLLVGAAMGGGDHFASAGERVIDTVVGSLIAILTVLIHRPRRSLPE